MTSPLQPAVKAMTDSERMVRVETLFENVATGQDRIESTLREVIKANEEWKKTHAIETQAKLDHHRAGVDQKFIAIEKALERKTDRSQSEERYKDVTSDIDAKASKTDLAHANVRLDKIDNHITKLVWLIVGAVVLAVLGMVVIKPDRASNPTAQLTVPAVIQQHQPTPAPVIVPPEAK